MPYLQPTTKPESRKVEEKDLIIEETHLTKTKLVEDLLPAVIRSEVNFLQFPFFALSWKGLRNKTEHEFRIVTERNGEKAELLWRVVATAKYGYPNPFDRRVARAIDALINEKIEQNGYPLTNPLQFSIYRIAQLMGVKDAGSIYKEIKESLERIALTGVQSMGTFFLKDEKRWLHTTFHLLDGVVFKGKETPDGAIADSNYLWFGEEYLRNINARHVKPLDYKYLASLKSTLASRLYELLSLKFYGLPPDKDHLRISYLNLCQALPITARKYYSDARTSLDPAHKELVRTGFLSKVSYQRPTGKKDKDFNILYFIGERAKKEKRGEYPIKIPYEERLWVSLVDIDEEEKIRPQEHELHKLSELAKELHKRGLSKSASMKLSKHYPDDLILEKIEVFDFLVKIRSDLIFKNPAGWLRQAIQEDFKPTAEQLKAKEAYERMQAEGERKARWIRHCKELIEQDLKDWDKTPPGERIKGILEFWLIGFKLKGVPTPAQEEIEAQKREFIKGLPKTEEEKRNHLAKKYLLSPPEDFI